MTDAIYTVVASKLIRDSTNGGSNRDVDVSGFSTGWPVEEGGE